MIIEFRVENFRSIADEQAISFERGLPVGNDPRPRAIAGAKRELLPVTAIYGANASGKSNVIGAIAQMRHMVLTSHNPYDLNGAVPVAPFAWAKWPDKPSLFDMEFVHEGVRYRYGFVANSITYTEEWLSAWPNGREQKLFVRDGEKLDIGEHFRTDSFISKEILRDNALFLSLAWQLNHPLAAKIGKFFHQMHCHNAFETLPPAETTRQLVRYLREKNRAPELVSPTVRGLLKMADIGIFDIKFEQTPFGKEMYLKHDQADESSWLRFSDESEGTKALLAIANPLQHALATGASLIVDELEASLHPVLALHIIRLFNNPQTNPANAQLIFSTHDTTLLGVIDGEAELRRDQVWFTEKDQQGRTKLYPLTDFKARKGENLERGYLQGRYGAIPLISKLLDAGGPRDQEEPN